MSIKTVIGTTATVACLPMAAFAGGQDLNWNYLQGTYVHQGEFDPDGGGLPVDGDGLELKASYAVMPHLLLQAGAEVLDFETPAEVAGDRAWVGPGVYLDMDLGALTVSPWARVTYERGSLGGASADGYGAGAGFRVGHHSGIELDVGYRYSDLEADANGGGDLRGLESNRIVADLVVPAGERWAITAGYVYEDVDGDNGNLPDGDFDAIRLGARWYTNPTPGGAHTQDKESPYSGANYSYVDAMYMIGDEVEANATDLDAEDGFAFRAAARVHERVAILGEFRNVDVENPGGAAEDIAYDWASIGPALRFGDQVGGTWVDLHIGPSFERANAPNSTLTLNGGGINAGVRWLIGDIEVAPSFKAFELGGSGRDMDGERYRVDLLYNASESVALLVNLDYEDYDVELPNGSTTRFDNLIYGAGLRFYYGNAI